MPEPVVILVDPVSSGASLSQAAEELGARPVHLYSPQLKDHFVADSHERKMLGGPEDAISQLWEMDPVVVWPGSEFGVTAANKVSLALGLPHNDPRKSRARRNKSEMIKAISDHGLAAAWTRTLTSAADVEEIIDGIGAYPIIIKPVDSAGSDGTSVCYGPDDIRSAYATLAGETNYMGVVNREIIAQEFIVGDQYAVNTVSVSGKHFLVDMYTEITTEVAGKPVLRELVLSHAIDAAREEVVAYAMACLDALGIREGAAHTEIRLTSNGPRIVEVNSRLMGPILPPDAFGAALGYSQATILAESVLRPEEFNRRLDTNYLAARHLGIVFLRSFRPGTITAMDGLGRIRRIPAFHSFAKLPRPGTTIYPDNMLTNGSTGMAYLVSDSSEKLQESIELIHQIEEASGIYSLL